MNFFKGTYTRFEISARRAVAWVLLVSFGFFQTPLYALPTAYTVVSGDVSFDTSQDNTLVITASDHSIIDFDSFSVGQGETVQFIQPLDSSSVLSRVTGTDFSQIFGSLFANGELLLVNPNGIHFGSTADIQVGSLIASTLDIQNANYLSSLYTFEKQDGLDPASILNEATIITSQGGYIALLSEDILNQGILTAYLGSVALGVGDKQTISFDSNGMINLVVDESLSYTPEESVIGNQGIIDTPGGKITITAKTLNDTFNHLINNSGVIEATRAEEVDGVVYFTSNVGNLNTGTIRTNTFREQGYTFLTTGTLTGGGNAYYNNIDGAANISGTIGSNQWDVGDLVVNGNITLDADNLIFAADCDNVADCNSTSDFVGGDDGGDGIGAFSMDPTFSIDGGAATNYSLTLITGADATLRTLINLGSLTLGRSDAGLTPTFTANNSITAVGGLTIDSGTTLDSNGQSVSVDDVTIDGTWITGASAITVSGSWDNTNGTFTSAGSTVEFDNPDAQTITSGGAAVGKRFNNLIYSGAGTLTTLQDDLWIDGTLTMGPTAGTFAMGDGLDITVLGLTTLNGGQFQTGVNGTTNTFGGGMTVSGGGFYMRGGLAGVLANNSVVINGDLNITDGGDVYVEKGGCAGAFEYTNTFTVNGDANLSGAGSSFIRGGCNGDGIVTLNGDLTVSDNAVFDMGCGAPALITGDTDWDSGKFNNGGCDFSRIGSEIGCSEIGSAAGDNDISDVGLIDSSKWRPDPCLDGEFVSCKDSGDEDEEETNEEVVTKTYVFEGAVDVNGHMVYDGEKIAAEKDKEPRISMRTLNVASAAGLEMIRAKTHEMIKRIRMKETPSAIVASKSSREVYSLTPKSRKLQIINAENFKGESNVLGISDGANDVVLSPDEKLAYISNTLKDTIQVIDLKTKEILRTISTGSMPTGLKVSSDGKNIFVANFLDKTISKIDLATGKSIQSFEVVNAPYALALSKNDEELFVTDRDTGSIQVLDASNGRTIASIKVGDSPYTLLSDSKFEKLYVSNRESGDISIIDMNSKKEIERIAVGKKPSGMALRPEEDKLYVANELSNNLALVDLTEQKLIQTIPTGTAPRKVVISTPER